MNKRKAPPKRGWDYFLIGLFQPILSAIAANPSSVSSLIGSGLRFRLSQRRYWLDVIWTGSRVSVRRAVLTRPTGAATQAAAPHSI